MNAAQLERTAPLDRSGGAVARAGVTMADVALLAVLVALAATLKHCYSNANAEELGWLLEPAARAVARVTGEPFVHEARVGFVAERLSIVVAPACSGLNFFVIALLTLGIGFVPRFPRSIGKILCFVTIPVFAYAATLSANTVRIAAAVGLHRAGVQVPFVSPAAAHRALGVVVYLASLWILYLATEAAVRRVTP